MKKIIIIGAGGHAKSCADVIKSKKEFSILGFIDNNLKRFQNIYSDFEFMKLIDGLKIVCNSAKKNFSS